MSIQIITISGIDGSGKSTQTGKLIDFLEKNGARAYHFHAIKFSIASFGKYKISTPGELKPVTKASWLSIQLRKVAFLIDIFRFEFFCKNLTKQGYTHIISDRYYFDALINILYLSNEKATHNFGVNALQKLIHIPEIAYYLHVSPQVIAARVSVEQQNEDYMRGKVDLYIDRAKPWGIQPVNGELTPDEIAHNLQEEVRSTL